MRSRTVREGSVGLLILVGIGLVVGLAVWIRGMRFNRGGYQVIVQLENANQLTRGASVRFRGVEVGEVTNIIPAANGVDLQVQIADANLRIPREVRVESNQSGLIGEASLDFFPTAALPPDGQATDPLSPECDSQIVLCNNDRVSGETGANIEELIKSTARAAELLSDPEFFANVNQVTLSASEAAQGIAEASRELSEISKSLQQELQMLTATTNQTADQISLTAAQLEQLLANVDRLVNENRGNLNRILVNLGETSGQLNQLLLTVSPTLEQLNASVTATDVQQLVENLETLTANAAEASTNLRDASQAFGDPNNLLVLQQTLDSARVTFENAEKITSDLDELTGNPEFRSNLRDLVNGLSQLVSSTQQLEQQLEFAQVLQSVDSLMLDESSTIPSLELYLEHDAGKSQSNQDHKHTERQTSQQREETKVNR